jgi:hypothetical protein
MAQTTLGLPADIDDHLCDKELARPATRVGVDSDPARIDDPPAGRRKLRHREFVFSARRTIESAKLLRSRCRPDSRSDNPTQRSDCHYSDTPRPHA